MSCLYCGGETPVSECLCDFCAGLSPVMPRSVPDLLRRIDQRLDQIREILTAQRRTDPRFGIEGWYHHLDKSQKVGISSTAYAVHALTLMGAKDSVDLFAVAEGILDHPAAIALNLNQEPGTLPRWRAWPMQSRPDVALIEPTCYVLQQLGAAGFLRRSDPRAQGAIAWVVSQQQPDHSWGPTSADPPNVYVTALACQVLNEYGVDRSRDEVRLAIEWLEGAMNDDQGWGWGRKDNKSNAWCTAHTLLALRGTRLVDPNAVLGVKWLRRNLRAWTDQLADDYFVESPSLGRVDVHYEFQPLPLVLLALDRAGVRPLAPDVFEGTECLLDQVTDGVWIPPSSTRKTIFNQSHSVQAVTAVRNRLMNAESIHSVVELALAGNSFTAREPRYVSPVSEGHCLSKRWPRNLGAVALVIAGGLIVAAVAVPPGTATVLTAATLNAWTRVTREPWLTAGAFLLVGIGVGVSVRWTSRGWLALAAAAGVFALILNGQGLWGVVASAVAAVLLGLLSRGSGGQDHRN